MSSLKVLSNGVRVAMNPSKAVETVAIGYFFETGSRYEKKNENGTAHFLEHLFFKGSKNFKAGDIFANADNYGAEMNAYTSKEETAYYMHGHKDMLDNMLFMLNDMVVNPTFPLDEINKERSVVVQEIERANDDNSKILYYIGDEASYPGHPMGWTTLGTSDFIMTVPREKIVGFKERHYNASTLVISVSGNFDPEVLVKKLEKMTEPLPLTSLKGRRCPSAKMAFGAAVRNREIDQLQYALRYPACSEKSKDRFATNLLCKILGGGLASRLGTEIRQKRGLTYGIGAGHIGYQDHGYVTIGTGIFANRRDEFEDALRAELVKIKDGVTQEELDRARNMIKGGTARGIESMSAMMSGMASHACLFNRPLDIPGITANLDKITTDKIREVANNVFSQKPVVSVIGRHVEETVDKKAVFDKFTL